VGYFIVSFIMVISISRVERVILLFSSVLELFASLWL
jgi:hypothetical protein